MEVSKFSYTTKKFLDVDLIQITIRYLRSQKQDKLHCYRRLKCSRTLKRTHSVSTDPNKLRPTAVSCYAG